jgi:putative transposase
VFKVWEDRFEDAFLSDSQMLNVKLDYIHANPLQEHWNLVTKPEDYAFSSARFYESGEKSNCEVTHFRVYF